jgi:hypothetical protein
MVDGVWEMARHSTIDHRRVPAIHYRPLSGFAASRPHRPSAAFRFIITERESSKYSNGAGLSKNMLRL